MHIAFCLDNNYIPHCATVIASIMDNNQSEKITFHLLSDSISENNKRMLTDWVSSYNSNNIQFYTINKEDFAVFPIEDAYINISTYFRLIMPYLLKGIDKVIYLDCDVIVNDSLKDLWNVDISNYALAGVRDRINDYIRVYNRLNYPMSYGYVNAGVLVINLEQWREDNIFEKATTIAHKIPKQLKNHDQDIINLVYHDSMLFLDFKFNLLEHFLYTEDNLYFNKKYYSSIEQACANPVIIHFCMPCKPWHKECINPFKHLYEKYKKMTPWPKLTIMKHDNYSFKKSFIIMIKRTMSILKLYHYVTRESPVRKNLLKIEDENHVIY